MVSFHFFEAHEIGDVRLSCERKLYWHSQSAETTIESSLPLTVDGISIFRKRRQHSLRYHSLFQHLLTLTTLQENRHRRQAVFLVQGLVQ
jgi:hypothetical protein